jgi:hypothetical protein
MKELWRVVSGYPDYAVSNMGRVKRLTRACGTHVGRILKPQKRGGDGPEHRYLYVDLFAEKKSRSCAIHRLVAEAFIPHESNLPEVNHKNPLKRFDNSVGNLEWATFEENTQHALLHGRLQKPHRHAKHIYAHGGKWRVIIQGVRYGTFTTRQQAQDVRQSVLSQKEMV